MSAKATGASAQNGSAQHRAHTDGSADRAFTPEQKEAVLRIKRCAPTHFYDILGLEAEKTTVTDAGIKKAYRKLSLLTHPDKNGYKGADEAFKMVSRAFQILSDPDKRKRFDQTGGDPDSRFQSGGASAAGASPFSGFARAASAGPGFGFGGAGGGPGGGIFEEEISPEELFRQFFGGGGFGGGQFGGPLFGGSPFGGSSFVFSGPGGVRVHQFGGGRPRRRPPGTGGAQRQEEQPTAGSALLNLLPIILLFVVMPLLSSLFGSGSGGSTWGTSNFKPPPISIDKPDPKARLTTVRMSKGLGVEYFHNPVDTESYDKKKWSRLDDIVEAKLVNTLDIQCMSERQTKQRLFAESQGWFSIDREKEEQARTMPMPGCERLDGLLPRRRNMW